MTSLERLENRLKRAQDSNNESLIKVLTKRIEKLEENASN